MYVPDVIITTIIIVKLLYIMTGKKAQPCVCVQSQLRQTRGQGERRHIRDNIKCLRRELRQRESSAVSDIIRRATVVLSTLTTASDDGPLGVLDQHKFDIIVIDECSQVVLSVIS